MKICTVEAISFYIPNTKSNYGALQRLPKWNFGGPLINYCAFSQIEYENAVLKPMKILHLTDIHITPDYEVNSVSNCGFPLCCKSGLASDLHESVQRDRAGKWGDYNCDIPFWLFGNMMQYIREVHPV